MGIELADNSYELKGKIVRIASDKPDEFYPCRDCAFNRQGSECPPVRLQGALLGKNCVTGAFSFEEVTES